MSQDYADYMEDRMIAALGDEQQDGERLEQQIEADRVRRGVESLADVLLGFSPSPLAAKRSVDVPWSEL